MDAKTAPSIKALFEPLSHSTTQSRSSHASTLRSSDEDQEYEAYALGRIGKLAQSWVDFRKSDGSFKSFSYTYLFSVESENPDQEFTAIFSPGARVTVRGRNLRKLSRYVRDFKADLIVEASRTEVLEQGKDAPVVESIEFKR